MNNIVSLLLSAIASLLALTVHEYAHGFVAYKLGDNTAKSQGRLSLNPISHLDPIGALCMILFHFGWAKPVPINPLNFDEPKKGFALCALAGPSVNIITGFLFMPLYMLSFNALDSTDVGVLLYIELFLRAFVLINIGLGIFNLIPIPPFDGSRILNVILPERMYFKIMKYEKQIYWGVIAWLLLGGYVYDALVSVPFIQNSAFLSSFARIFSLSGLINSSISGIAQLIIKFWSLIIK